MKRNKPGFSRGVPLVCMALVWSPLPPGSALSAEGAIVTLDQCMTKCGYIAVPLKWGADNHLFARATVGGKDARCMIDTGAVDSVIEITKASGLTRAPGIEGPRYGVFATDRAELPAVLLDPFELQGNPITNQQAVIWNLYQDRRLQTGSWIPRPTTPDEADLVLGMSCLRAVHAWVDCREPRLYIRPESPGDQLSLGLQKSLVAGGFEQVPVTPLENGSILLVHSKVDGASAAFLLDTGASVTLVARDLLGEIGLPLRYEVECMVDASGRHERAWYARATSFALGEFELQDLPVATTKLRLPHASATNGRDEKLPLVFGFLGTDILNRAAALIDCGSGRVYLNKQVRLSRGR